MKDASQIVKAGDLFDEDELDMLDEALDVEEGNLEATRTFMCGDNNLSTDELKDALDDIARKQEAFKRVRRWIDDEPG